MLKLSTKQDKKISLEGLNISGFTGVRDSNLKLIQKSFKGRIVLRGEEIFVSSSTPEELEKIEQLILLLKAKLKKAGFLREEDVKKAIENVKGERMDTDEKKFEKYAIKTPKKTIIPRTENQLKYLMAIEENDIVVGVGPAGTGKTFLAVAMAIKYLREGRVEKIVLTRPAVEAGESLGFLPGDYEEKISPYLTPLYDALYSMMTPDAIKRLTDRRVIEIAPLAYMRGRTLSDAFVILDEAQNTKSVQMKMFLTRLGPRSKVVITGDTTQIDLPKDVDSGLVEIQKVLKSVPGIAFIRFGPEDVVRHRLVKDIVEAYEKYQKE